MRVTELFEKRPDWHDSDAPDANGKFRDLSIDDLADWLIKTRKGDMRRITGSLNQQIVFNRGRNPKYADKMEKVRAAIKRKLKEDKDDPVEQLRKELLLQKGTIQAVGDIYGIYDLIDAIMTKICSEHSLTGDQLHDMWVKRYKEIPDTWIMKQ